MTEHNLFQEVEEDLERQRIRALWDKYGPLVITAALGVVIATASASAYRSWKSDHEQKLTAVLAEAKNGDGEIPAKIEKLREFGTQNLGESQATLALLQAAALAAEQNDMEKAAQIYEQVAADTKATPVLRQLGEFLAVHVQLDKGEPGVLMGRLQPLTVEGGTWRFSALEDMGYLALRAGDKAKAKLIFTGLSQDGRAPRTLSERVATVLRSLN